MKSSPKSNEMPPSTGSKTPASGKKLVQARLPFKTLGGSEPPFTATNDTSDPVLTAANMLIPDADNRKRKQSTVTAKDDGVREPKLNRLDCDINDDVILVTTEAMELSCDVPSGNDAENGAKCVLNRNSESKENVYMDKSCDDVIASVDDSRSEEDAIGDSEPVSHISKAKQSLEFSGERLEKRKKRSDTSRITIKLPMSKKSKKAKRAKKSDLIGSISNIAPNEDELPLETDMEVDADPNDVSVWESIVDDSENEEVRDADELNQSALDDSILSNGSEHCSTPASHKLTPKQIQRRLESEKKKQEKEQARIDRERKLQEEKELRQREKADKELQKKREREEKDEQRKKEKELREQKLLEEKMEKQREKELKEQQRKIEREEKEEQRKREKEEKELQKKKEREEKEREKEEERKKKEDEKRQKIEAEQNKNRKTAEAFVKFFVAKQVDNKSESNENDENMDIDQEPQMFMSFQVKEDMKIAPVTRRVLNSVERASLEHIISSESLSTRLYLSELKSNALVPRKASRTWQDDEDEKCSNGDDLFIIEEDGQGVQVVTEEPNKLYRAKFFKFDENRRPPYYGTWRKKSKTVGPRKPLGLDSRLDYEVDSDDEWEEEEPGESLNGSDDEKEVVSEDEYEIDNEFFVPHGHLSDEELQNDDGSDLNDQENLKLKLKLAQNELEDERKKKTQKLKPRLIGLIWQNFDGSKPIDCSNGVWELMNKHALFFNGPSVKVDASVNQQAENSDDENSIGNKPLGVRRLQIGEKDIPDLIKLINGNQNNSKFLVKEFSAYLAKNHQPQREYSSASIKAKIKDLAIWQACPEEGRMFKKMCWYVPIETRKRYGLNDLTFPNTWSYTLPPRRPVELTENESGQQAPENANKDADKKSDAPEIISLSDDSNSCTLSETLTPELIKQASSKRAAYNIAKFIRPLTQDEKKKQFEPLTLNRHFSEDKIQEGQLNDSQSTSQAAGGKSKAARGTKRASKSSPEASTLKKRIKPLMSGPVGHELPTKLKTTLVTQFLSHNSIKKRKCTEMNSDATEISSTSTAGTSDGAKKKTKLDDALIVISE